MAARGPTVSEERELTAGQEILPLMRIMKKAPQDPRRLPRSFLSRFCCNSTVKNDQQEEEWAVLMHCFKDASGQFAPTISLTSAKRHAEDSQLLAPLRDGAEKLWLPPSGPCCHLLKVPSRS
jgi:hypothetical protein